MIRILSVCFSLLVLSISTNPLIAKEINSKKFIYDIDFGIQAFSADSTKVNAKLWSIKPKLVSQYNLDERSTFFFDFGASLETGSNRSFRSREFNPQRNFFVYKALFQYELFENLAFEMGAINQEIYHSPIFVEYLAFVGLRQMYKTNLGPFDIQFFAQQSIPNNQDLSNRVSYIQDGSPLFYAETLELGYNTPSFRFLVAYTHFMFKNLSQNFALESKFLGNTVVGSQQSTARFVYEYQGHNTVGVLSYKSENFLLEFQGQYLHNDRAPNSLADAYFGGLYVGAPYLFAHLEKYRIEGDATISYYNSALYGHTNRDGFAVGFTYDKVKDYSFTLLYHNQKPINTNQEFIANRNLVTLLYKKDL